MLLILVGLWIEKGSGAERCGSSMTFYAVLACLCDVLYKTSIYIIELQLKYRCDFARTVSNAQLGTCTGMNHRGCLSRGIL